MRCSGIKVHAARAPAICPYTLHTPLANQQASKAERALLKASGTGLVGLR